MPRQDVPYGGAICRLRERIAEIFDKLGEKLHTINGVPGDGDGNVKIVSGSSAVVITNDPTQNEISVALDNSQLPAAAVSSVNGQTGTVALDAGDIPSDGNSDVQSDIDALQTMDGALQGNINAEALARQNADSALQTNINTVSASLPAAAAAAVAADPTVAQLATDVPNKVDKITSGSSLKAYTHTGATQGETSVVDGTAANSIGIRDANGRMRAADPASGATDKTLVTANWVSQTGDSSPNNLVHRRGSETIYDDKLFDSPIKTKYFLCNKFSITPQNNKYWVKVYTYNNASRFAVPSFAFTAVTREHSDIIMGTVQLNQSSGTVQSVTLKGITTDNSRIKPLFVVTSESANEFTLWYNCEVYTGGLRANVTFSLASNYAADNVTSLNEGGAPQQAYDISSSGYTDEHGVTHTFVAYAVMT